MDDLFGFLDGRLRISVIDATMMWIVHYAMDKAHGKVKSKEGVMERLNEISKFYELAVIQLEGCIKFVQDETDSHIRESCHEKVLADLTEIRDRLLGRLKESELAISEKDRELTERFENELKLRQVLELREREMSSLLASLELETKESQDVAGFTTLNNPVSGVKVDQQVWHIKQPEPDYGFVDEERGRDIDDRKVEQLSNDINFLKESLGQAFNKMQDALFLSELEPEAQQWKWNIEKDAIYTMIKGFMEDFKETFEVEMRKQEKQVSVGLSEHFSDLMKEVKCLRNELEHLLNQNENQSKAIKGHESLVSSSRTNFECSIPPKAKRSLSVGDNVCNSNMFSTKIEEGGKQLCRDEPEEDGGHYVAKMIKNHESIIRRKSEELNWLKREILREKVCSSFRREKDPVIQKKRIQEVIGRLDMLINCNARPVETFEEYGGDQRKETSTAKGILESDPKNKVKSGVDSLEDVWKKVNSTSCSDTVLKKLQNGLVNQFHTELDGHGMKSYESYSTESLIREQISRIVLDETIRDIVNTANYKLSKLQEGKVPDNFMYGSSIGDESEKIAECLVKENVFTVFFREIIDEWKMEIDACNIENLIREEIHQFVVVEAAKDACLACIDREAQKQDKTSADKSYGSLKGSGEESLIENLDMLLKCFDEDEVLMLRASTEIKEQNAHLDLVGLEHEELNDHESFQAMLNNNETTFISVTTKLEKALGQLTMSKTILSELESSLGTAVSDPESVHDQITTIEDILHDRKSFICQQKNSKEFHIDQSVSVFTRIQEFSQVFMNFECQAHEKLGDNVLRLEEVKQQLDSLIELVDSIQKRESLYRKAFITRCQNLQKAENEVDLLGDQVDVLLTLLEKIYMTLHHYSPVLQQHFGLSDDVSEILSLIQKELIGAAHVSSK